MEPLDEKSLESIWSRSPNHDKYLEVKKELREEINYDYLQSVKRGIVDYILIDESERERLTITECPMYYQPTTIRAPVPWRNSYEIAQQFCISNLHITSKHIRELQNLWFSQYKHASFVSLEFNTDRSISPKSPSDFYQSICDSSDEMRNILATEWLTKCSDIIKNGLADEREELRLDIIKNGAKPDPSHLITKW